MIMYTSIQSKLNRRARTTAAGRLLAAILAVVAVGWLIACAPPDPLLTPTPIPPTEELVLYNWTDYMPQSVLDAFQAEYGIHVIYLTYETMEEAVANIRSGQVVYDVAVIVRRRLGALLGSGAIGDLSKA